MYLSNTSRKVVLDGVFPKPDYRPSHSTKLAEVLLITPSVTGDLLPPIRAELMLPNWIAPTMPEIPVDKYGDAVPRENKIRAAWKILRVAFER